MFTARYERQYQPVKRKITATIPVDRDTRQHCRPVTVRTAPLDTSAEMKAVRVTDDAHVFRNSRFSSPGVTALLTINKKENAFLSQVLTISVAALYFEGCRTYSDIPSAKNIMQTVNLQPAARHVVLCGPQPHFHIVYTPLKSHNNLGRSVHRLLLCFHVWPASRPTVTGLALCFKEVGDPSM